MLAALIVTISFSVDIIIWIVVVNASELGVGVVSGVGESGVDPGLGGGSGVSASSSDNLIKISSLVTH